jgi:protein-S-isoprenylcysteine O-methyltransferase Ste14
MRKFLAMVGSAVFLVIAPGFVAGLVPWWISHWRIEAPFFGMQLFRFVGAVLLTLGVVVLLDSFLRFALQGIGTPAPVFPTRHLVVSGLYRYVRNPMYVAVEITILGQGLIFGNLWLLATYGSEYESFCAQVPRWIPHVG